MPKVADVKSRLKKDILQNQPQLLKQTCPRHYIIPQGYCSPQSPGLKMATMLRYRVPESSQDFITGLSYFVVERLAQFQVPTYWLGREMLKALLHTELPNLHGSKLQWPLPAMLFMLPKGLLCNPGGISIDFLGIAKHEDLLICWTQIDEKGSFPNYASSERIQQMFLDQIKPHKNQEEIELYGFDDDNPKTEQEFLVQLTTLAVHLLLVMNARPDVIEIGSIPNSIRGFGKTINEDAPWTPNWIGRSYRYKQEPHSKNYSPSDSTVRPHWRRGYYREQRYGKGLELSKVIWVDPVFINASNFGKQP